MTTILIAIFLTIIILIIWFKEARIFLFILHKMVYPSRHGSPLNIDKHTEFPESLSLEKNWKVIRQELKNVMLTYSTLPEFHEVDKSNAKISFDNRPAWRTIVIKAYDGWFTDNCKMFPQTINLLQDIPSVSTAMFSILEPHVRIPPRTGKFSGILRYHLALSVPAFERCYIEVNGEKYYWKEGEGILFNDTYLHSVTNDTDEYRIVLFLDIKKKTSFIVEILNKFVLYAIRSSPVFKRAVKTGMITTG